MFNLHSEFTPIANKKYKCPVLAAHDADIESFQYAKNYSFWGSNLVIFCVINFELCASHGFQF
jgi:hypothetical protein